jgi:hypothetical protein
MLQVKEAEPNPVDSMIKNMGNNSIQIFGISKQPNKGSRN